MIARSVAIRLNVGLISRWVMGHALSLISCGCSDGTPSVVAVPIGHAISREYCQPRSAAHDKR